MRRCEIFIPDSAGILHGWLLPTDKKQLETGVLYPVQWDDPIVGGVLAHEILHCVRGSWHPNG